MLVGNNILSNSYGESTLLLILVCLSIALNFKFKVSASNFLFHHNTNSSFTPLLLGYMFQY